MVESKRIIIVVVLCIAAVLLRPKIYTVDENTILQGRVSRISVYKIGEPKETVIEREDITDDQERAILELIGSRKYVHTVFLGENVYNCDYRIWIDYSYPDSKSEMRNSFDSIQIFDNNKETVIFCTDIKNRSILYTPLETEKDEMFDKVVEILNIELK